MNPKQQRFVQEYLVDLNATQAAIRAGYAEKGAHVQGSRLLSNAKVQALIEAAQGKHLDKLEAEAEDVIQELARLGFSNLTDYFRVNDEGEATLRDFETLTEHQQRAIHSVKTRKVITTRGDDPYEETTTEFKLHDKIRPLEALGRHLGLFEKDNRQRAMQVNLAVLMPTSPEDYHAASERIIQRRAADVPGLTNPGPGVD